MIDITVDKNVRIETMNNHTQIILQSHRIDLEKIKTVGIIARSSSWDALGLYLQNTSAQLNAPVFVLWFYIQLRAVRG